jgi:hypothetical protein
VPGDRTGVDLDALLRGERVHPPEVEGRAARSTVPAAGGHEARPGYGTRSRGGRLASRIVLGVAVASAIGTVGAAWESRRQAAAERSARAAATGVGADAPATRTVEVVSVPSDALVLVDGMERGRRSPVVTPGLPNDRAIVVRVTRAGYRDFVRLLPPAAATPQRLVAALEPGTGILSVRSTPAGATVSVGGRAAGRTPLVLGDVDTTAPHVLQVAAPGYQTAARTVDPGSGWRSEGIARSLLVQVVLQRTPRGARALATSAAAPPATPMPPPRAAVATPAGEPPPSAGADSPQPARTSGSASHTAADPALKLPSWAAGR